MDTQTNSVLCNVFQMARALGITTTNLKKAAGAGEVPCLKIGRVLLFNREAVEKAVAERAATSTLARRAEATPADAGASAGQGVGRG